MDAFLFWLLLLVIILLFLLSRKKEKDVLGRLTLLENRIDALNKLVLTKLEQAPSSPEPHAEAPEVPPKATPTPPPITPEPAAVEPKPPEPAAAPPPRPDAPGLRPSLPAINWERFMGVKLLAWVGALALFLGLAFFVKYSFEHDLITPEMRVAIGYLAGAGLLAAGFFLPGKGYAVLGQSLAAAGILVLYASTFAAHSFYHFIGFILAFTMMVLITLTAFLLAVRLEAQVVAVLGLLGGFLTPILLSTGQDNPLGLFGYLALLDAGLFAVSSRTRWTHLIFLAAVATCGMQWAWVAKFFTVAKAYTGMTIFLSMEVLFLAAFAWNQKKDEEDTWINWAAFLQALIPMVFALYLLDYNSLAAKPWAIFTFVFLADLGLLSLALWRTRLAFAYFVGGLMFFLVLCLWTMTYLTDDLLNWGLFWYFIFAVLHSCFPLIRERLGLGSVPWWWGWLFPGLAFLLIMLPVAKLPGLPATVWLCLLFLNCLVFALALLTGVLEAVLGALFMTIATMALWIVRLPAASSAQLPELILIIGGFALLFFVAGIMAMRPQEAPAETPESWRAGLLKAVPDVQKQIPSLSASLPFFLLVLVVLRLPLANPTPVFGLALVLVILMLVLGRLITIDWLFAVGLACSLMLEYVWHFTGYQPEAALVPLLWYLTFYAVFALAPFVFRPSIPPRVIPFVVAALSGPLHFGLIYRIVDTAYPNPFMGLLPAAFAVPSLGGLFWIVRRLQTSEDIRRQLMAWWGGAALFFITLIFPIQFEKEWITLGWALEGVALLWLFHRVPHPGLRLAGIGLLGVAFIRLAFNPAVLTYHPRSGTPILNWYLYTYGITTASLLAGARLLRPPHHLVRNFNVLPCLYGMAGVLAFFLLNIEIADFFSIGEKTLTFQFYGNFARDMTYSIAWALFALGLLIIGTWKNNPVPRYASLGLLGITLIKLFFHDLARLDAVYRIGAFLGVAVVLLLASFTYQRFLSREPEKP